MNCQNVPGGMNFQSLQGGIKIEELNKELKIQYNLRTPSFNSKVRNV